MQVIVVSVVHVPTGAWDRDIFGKGHYLIFLCKDQVVGL